MVADELDVLLARLVALEAVVKHVTVPLLVATGPELAHELLQEIRKAPPTQGGHLGLMVAEYLAKLADGIEARVRSKIDTRPMKREKRRDLATWWSR